MKIDGFREFRDEGIWPQYEGTYHIYHRIDDVLVAVNVWDITKISLGSIYTFYDPDYKPLSLGHITSIREIEYMKNVKEKYNPDLQYYYMGYYVNNC